MQAIQIPRKALFFITALSLSAVPTMTCAQASAPAERASADGVSSLEFEVATIKPFRSPGHLGFISYPNGKVDIGAEPLTVLLAYAFDVQTYQIKGGPDWASTDRYDLIAQPEMLAGGAAKASIKSFTPSLWQQVALQKLLVQRFALKFHIEKRQESVYVLTRGSGALMMNPAKDQSLPQAAAILDKGDKIDGEAFGRNATMSYLAQVIGSDLDRPVIDQTGVTGSYDFHLPPFDPNNTDVSVAIFKDMERLGLKLKPGKGLVETVVIDSAQRPTPN